MEPLFYVMAIMGCGDGNAQCQQVRIEPVRYESAAQCRAAVAGVLMESTDIPYPVIEADCQQQGVRMAQKEPRHEG